MTANQDLTQNDFGLTPTEAELFTPAAEAMIERIKATRSIGIWGAQKGGVAAAETLGNNAFTELVLADATGSMSPAWGDAMVKHFAGLGGDDADQQVAMVSQGIGFLSGIHPNDTLEAVTGAQLYALHLLAMKLAPAALNDSDNTAIGRLVEVLKLTGEARDALVQMKGTAHG